MPVKETTEMKGKTPFWTMKTAKARNDAGEEEQVGEIRIYGYLLEDSWWDEDITPKAFIDELKSLGDVKNLHVHINSYGGHVSAGFTVYSILKQHQAKVTVYVDGFALSAASVVAMAGDTVIMPGNAMMMIHNPSSGISGDARDLRKAADVLDKMRDSMIAAYQDKTGLPKDELITMLDDETWFTADEAAEKGFADIVEAPLMAAASVKPGVVAVGNVEFDLTGYRNVPEGLKKEMEGKDLDSTKENGLAGNAAQDTQKAPEAAPGISSSASAEEIEKAVKAERDRIKALDGLHVPGAEAIIAKAKYETGISPEQAAVEIIKAGILAGTKAFDERKSDADDSGVNVLSAVNNGAALKNADAFAEKAKALKESIEKGREVK
ncbi:MAG: Clp protease ClpP [Synergistaceae bacterium]|jgi:ATP-dependent protease ClpP protease subunit|nr:Clp protease ClpP [Synergistaceae bacterium]